MLRTGDLQICVKCDLPFRYVAGGGITYCCRGCYEGTGCTCRDPEQAAPPLRRSFTRNRGGHPRTKYATPEEAKAAQREQSRAWHRAHDPARYRQKTLASRRQQVEAAETRAMTARHEPIPKYTPQNTHVPGSIAFQLLGCHVGR